MTVLFADGYTGAPRGSTVASLTPLVQLGYTPLVINNGTQVVTPNASWAIEVAADAIFAERNRFCIRGNFHNYAWVGTVKKPLNTSGISKFVVGCLCETFPTTAAGRTQFMIGGTTLPTNSGAVPADTLAVVSFNNTTQEATLYVAPDFNTPINLPGLKSNVPFHFEALVEDDVDRCRIYLDGTLVADFTYSSTFASANGGVTLSVRFPDTASNTMAGGYYSNFYVLGIDSIHTGILGPAARILEVAPASDMVVSWKRPDGYASNAEVLGQMFNAANPAYLAAANVGDYDVYTAPNAVAANASQVFGAGIKVNAMTMAGGTHTLRAVVKTPTAGVSEVGDTITLTSALAPSFSDISTNPETGALWTPSAVTASGFGMKLKS